MRLLQSGWAYSAAAAVGGVGVGAARQVHHQKRRVGLLRHSSRALYAMSPAPLRSNDRQRGNTSIFPNLNFILLKL